MICIFCEVAKGNADHYRVYEDEHSVAFLDANPVTEGHTLVIPREHFDDIWAIDSTTFRQVAEAVHQVSQLIKSRLNAPGLTLFQANRRDGWQDVFHLHVHVVPRHAGDELVRPWQSSPSRRGSLSSVAERLGATARH